MDYNALVMQGFANGRNMRKSLDMDKALNALSAKPDDPAATAQIMRYDPSLGMQVMSGQQQRLQQATKQQEEQAKKLTEVFGRAARAAKTPQQWDAIAGWLAQNGVAGAEKVIGKFSPEMRAGYMAQAGLDDDAQDPTSMQRNYEFLKGIDEKLAQSYLQGQADPTQWIRTEDSTGVHITPVPRSGPAQAGGQQPAEPPAPAIERLRANPHEAAQFDEIFGPGSAARAMGGQAPQAPGGFR